MRAPSNPIRAAALIIVAVTSAFLMWMAYKITDILAAPDWCARALRADAMTPDARIDGLKACVDLLTIQLKSLATNSHILFGTIALCLGVLVVIVLAGARLAGKVFGNEIDVSRQDAEATGAQKAAGAAQEKADDIKEGADNAEI